MLFFTLIEIEITSIDNLSIAENVKLRKYDILARELLIDSGAVL